MDTVRIDSLPPSSPDPAAERDSGWATAAHLLALTVSLLAAIIVNIAVGKHNAYVRQHARQAVNFQLNLAVGAFVALVLMAVDPAFVLLWLPLGLAAVALPIRAAVLAHHGAWVPYPPMIPFLRALPAAAR